VKEGVNMGEKEAGLKVDLNEVLGDVSIILTVMAIKKLLNLISEEDLLRVHHKLFTQTDPTDLR
jgi:hypothetical protein